jgi:predicted nucleic acid-binding Zn finger protein
MTQEQLTRRRGRAQSETFVIAQVEDGFRVYAPSNPTKQYVVGGTPDAPTCTCPDFRFHAREGNWRCKHILAVLKETAGAGIPATAVDPAETEERLAIQEEGRIRTIPDPPVPTNGSAHMVLKRSVSPDGHIDSLSVEFTCPVDRATSRDIVGKALKTLKLQGEIVAGFLSDNGKDKEAKPGSPAIPTDAVRADLLDVAGMNTRWGRRLFINVKVNGETLKLFGSKTQLEEAVSCAGFPELRDRITEGATIAIPCRVTTKASDNGKYRNVDRVFPVEAQAAATRPR